MLLKLPCRFGEIFEAEAGGEKKEFILTGFSHGIWDTPDISVSEFPAAGSRLSLSMDAAPTEYTLELPHNLYEHQSSENFGFARKVKGKLGAMSLKNGKAVFAFHPASSPAFPFYGESPVLEELLRPVLPQPLTEAELQGQPLRALYTFQSHGKRMYFYARNGADLTTAFSVLRDVMPLFRLNRDSQYHREILGALSDRQTPSGLPDQPALREAMRHVRWTRNTSAGYHRILSDLKYHTAPKAPPLFHTLYDKEGRLAADRFDQTAACRLHVTVDLDRERVSFHWNPLCFSERLPAALTVGIGEGVDCLERLSGEIRDAGQLAAAMEAPLRRLQTMADHPFSRSDLRIDPELLIVDGGVNAYLECWDGYRERLGLELGPDDSVNIYGQYDPASGEAALSYIVHYWDGRVGEETRVTLSIQERKLLLSEMNKTCLQELGVTMDDFLRQEHTPDPGGMTLR